jgi:hypothetical protein
MGQRIVLKGLGAAKNNRIPLQKIKIDFQAGKLAVNGPGKKKTFLVVESLD